MPQYAQSCEQIYICEVADFVQCNEIIWNLKCDIWQNLPTYCTFSNFEFWIANVNFIALDITFTKLSIPSTKWTTNKLISVCLVCERQHDRSWFWAPPMLAHRYVEENNMAAMLVTKRSAGITPKVKIRQHVTHRPPPSANKAAHSGFETQKRHHQKSKTGVSVAPQKGLRVCSHWTLNNSINVSNVSLTKDILPIFCIANTNAIAKSSVWTGTCVLQIVFKKNYLNLLQVIKFSIDKCRFGYSVHSEKHR